MATQNFPEWYLNDQQFIWHPYSAFTSSAPLYPVETAYGSKLKLSTGQELVDGMASWWCVIHGYHHPVITSAMKQQIDSLSHVMFGGLTHEPAADLAKKLVEITPKNLQSVFFADSGSVSVEVALKLAIQYWQAKDIPSKQKFISYKQGYHGDTLGAMSVCDPVTGMHSLFNDVLPQQYFVSSPVPSFEEECKQEHLKEIKQCLEQNHLQIAAVIIEPVVQGAGGMWFYSPQYLSELRKLCDEYNVLLIVDEIATGFGRTGKLFASEHANISADIMCVGKSLTGGYISLAATLTTIEVADSISNSEPGLFMHGPTFMANPLACRTALASINLLESMDWQANIHRIENHFKATLSSCAGYETVKQVRVLGAIGVVEMVRPVDMNQIVAKFVEAGVWVRPFGKLVYLMPPFIIEDNELEQLTAAVQKITKDPAVLLSD